MISALILKTFGWKVKNSVALPEKCVICIAPHTSNWDFIWGMCFNRALKIRSRFFMKKEWFRFPLGKFFRSLGGVAVDRSAKTSLTDALATEFSLHKRFRLSITPEGTRRRNPEWKRGFYYIALKAKVPIVLAAIDYKRKELGCGKILFPTGNYEIDFQEIKDFYKNITAKKPRWFAV